MSCSCRPKMVVPIELSVAGKYWGHIDIGGGQWKIEKWLPAESYETKCDRCLAEEEQLYQQQNSLTIYITPWVIYACNSGHAAGIFQALWMGTLIPDSWYQPKNRFVDLLDELYNS